MNKQDYINLLNKGMFTVMQELTEQGLEHRQDYKLAKEQHVFTGEYVTECTSYNDGDFVLWVYAKDGIVTRIEKSYKKNSVEKYRVRCDGSISYIQMYYNIDSVDFDEQRKHATAYTVEDAFSEFASVQANSDTAKAIVTFNCIWNDGDGEGEKFRYNTYLHYDVFEGIHDIDYSEFD